MRLKCKLVSQILPSLTEHDTYPQWITNHLEKCESCERMAKSYESIRATLGTMDHDDDLCSTKWSDISSEIAKTPVKHRSNRLAPVLALSACVAAVAICFVSINSIRPRPLSNDAVVALKLPTVKKAESTTDLPRTHIAAEANQRTPITLPRIKRKVELAKVERHKGNRRRQHRHLLAKIPPEPTANNKSVVTPKVQELHEQQLASASSDAGYKAGKVVGQHITSIAEHINISDFDKYLQIAEKIKRFVKSSPEEEKDK